MLHIFTLLIVFQQVCQIRSDLNETTAIIDLYKRITEKGSLAGGLSLNEQAQLKLKTVNTIRLLPLTMIKNSKSLLFQISLHQLKINEEIKLIELRLKLNRTIRRKQINFIIRKNLFKRQIFRPTIISNDISDHVSYDITGYLDHNTSNQTLIIRRQSWIRNHLKQASIVIYSRASGTFLLPSMRKRSKRSITNQPVHGPCSKHDLMVDFDQLPFGTWVVQPKRFNAGICLGDCPNPLSRLFYPTNHAMLLSLLHEQGNSIQQPSCVPVRLRPLDLLYYDHRELVIKRHQSMQVEECGCR